MKVVLLISLIVCVTAKCSFKGTISNTERRCPRGWERLGPRYSDKCVMLSTSRLNFKDAKELCKSMDSKLLSISNEEEQSSLTAYLLFDQNYLSNVWLGAQRLPGQNSSFVWLDGTVMGIPNPNGNGFRPRYGLNGRFANYATNQPDDYKNRGENCLELLGPDSHYLEDDAGKWNDQRCSKRRAVLCTKSVVEPQPEFAINGDCSGGEGKNMIMY